MQALQKQVGMRIREIREQKGLSQEALADICNRHRTYIGLIERGERNLSMATVEQIAAGLEVAAAEFFTGSKETSIPAPPRAKKPKPAPDLMAHIETIRQVLFAAKVTDERRYETMYETNRKKS